MADYVYKTYRVETMIPSDADVLLLTPKQQRAIRERINAAIERSMIDALTGGYYVPSLHEGPKGVTIEHVRRTPPLLPDPRRGAREGGAGSHQPCAAIGATENQSEGGSHVAQGK